MSAIIDGETILKGKSVATEFLRLYSLHAHLYDQSHKEYKNNNLRTKVLQQICEELAEFCQADKSVFTEAILKKKFSQMRNEYGKQKIRYEKSITTGAAAADIKQPKLFYYQLMDSMLGAKVCRTGKETTEPDIYLDRPLTTTITRVDEDDEDESSQVLFPDQMQIENESLTTYDELINNLDNFEASKFLRFRKKFRKKRKPNDTTIATMTASNKSYHCHWIIISSLNMPLLETL